MTQQQAYPIKCRIRNHDDGTPTRVDVYDDIGGGGWFFGGLTPKDFADQLAGVTGALEVHVSSGGGDVFDGIAIANTIRGYKGGPKTTVNDGIAASIASVIFQAGDERVAQQGSMCMIHDAFGAVIGNAAEARKFADTLDQVSDNIAGIYASRAGGTVEQWRAAMKEETWYTADEAVTAGLADKVGDGTAELPAGMDVAAFSAVPGRIAAALRNLPQAKAPAEPQDPAPAEPAPAPVIADSAPPAPGGKAGKKKGKKARARKKDQPRGEADGACCSLCGPDCACGGQPAAHGPVIIATAGRTRILGIESMPLLNEALPVHHTATIDEKWDGPAAVAAMPGNAPVLRYCHAWQDTASDDGTADDPDSDADDRKASYKFPHHKGKGAPANLAACRNGLARLSGAGIPDSDRAAVRKHLQAHLDDGGSGDDSDDAGNHVQHDLAGIGLDEIRAALKGAHA